jgi:hypothetical protein
MFVTPGPYETVDSDGTPNNQVDIAPVFGNNQLGTCLIGDRTRRDQNGKDKFLPAYIMLVS